jgi:hypothetical protein
LRFLVELLAWIAGPWGVADLAGSAWAAVPAVVLLLALPAVFSTPGDKEQVIVATPGPVRLVIELVLSAVAVIGAWIAWPTGLAVLVSLIVATALVTGMRRAQWLLQGAPAVD